MKTRSLPRFAAILGAGLFTTATASAQSAALPTAEPPSLTIHVGKSGRVCINPPSDVLSPNSSVKVHDSFTSTIISVAPGVGEVVTPSGTSPAYFTITGLATGNATLQFTYTDTMTGNSWSVFVPFKVVIPGDTTATINQTADAGDPVDTRNGEYYANESVPLRLGGPMPLSFAIYNASRLSADGRLNSTLGGNRAHSFETAMVYAHLDHRDIVTNHGRVISFTKTAGTWTLSGRTDIPYQLVQSGANFILADPHSQRMLTYSGANGRLLRIEDGRGNTHTLTYPAGGQLATVADGLGRILTFTYTPSGSNKLTRVTDHTGRQVNFVRPGSVLTSMTDPLGHTTTYASDANFRLTSFTRPVGNVPFTQASTNGRVTSQTERTTDTSTLAYAGNTTTFTAPTGATLVDTYAATGELATHTDEAGHTITMASDATGRRSSVTDREGDTTTISYHALSGKPAVITNAEGRTVTMAYAPRVLNGLTFFDLASVTFTDGTQESYTRDAFGNVLSRTDRAGKQWTFTYNSRGQPLTATNPLGGVSIFTYDAAGNLASRKDPDTDPTTYAWDTLSRLTTITRPGGATVTYTYDAGDRLLTTTDERGKITTFAYDNNDRLTTLTDPDAKTTTYAYDVLDRVQQVTDRTGATGSVTYNSRHRLASATDRNGNATTFAYDARLRPTGITDTGGKTWTRGFDNEGLLTSAANPTNPPGLLVRNTLGRVIEIRDALGNTARVTRDAMQRVTRSVDPLGRATVFTYDARGLLASAAEQGTGTATYARDPLGSLSKITDSRGGEWLFTYTPAGRSAGLTDPLGRTSSHTYDARGRRAVTTFADTTTLTRTYDAASNVTRRLFTNGTDLTFTYDNLSRLTATNDIAFTYDAEGRITNSAQAGQNFGATYDAGGRLLTLTSPSNGAPFTVTYAYDTRDRLVSVGDTLSSATIAFTYDDAGRLLTMTRSNGVNATHTYDAAGRLTRIQDGTVLDLKYTLNASREVSAADLTAPLLPPLNAGTQSRTFNAACEITTAGYAYDARGRLTAAPGGAFAWDGASRLKTAAGVALNYNGLGDLLTRTAGGATTRFFYNYAPRLHPIVAEKTEGGAFLRYYVWTPGGRLLYGMDAASGQPVFYHFDRIGSTLALTNHTGAVADAYAYGPYGEPLARTGTSPQPFTYVGAYGVRAEGNLYHMRARYYDPQTARFLSRDPIWPSLANPKRLNPYEYAAQSPGEFIDPKGTREELNFGEAFFVTFLGRRADEFCDDYFDDGKVDPPAPVAASATTEAAPAQAAAGFRIALDSSPLASLPPSCFRNNTVSPLRVIGMTLRSEPQWTVWDGVDNKQYLDLGDLGRLLPQGSIRPDGDGTSCPDANTLWGDYFWTEEESLTKPRGEGEGTGDGRSWIQESLTPATDGPKEAPQDDSILNEIDEVIVIS